MAGSSGSHNSIRSSASGRRSSSARSASHGGSGVHTASAGSARGHGASRSPSGGNGRRNGGPGDGKRRQNMSQVLHDGPKLIDWIADVVKIVLIALVILFSISISGQAYEIGYSIFYEEAVDEEGDGTEIEVTITEGMSVAQIGTMLEEAGLLLDGSVFQYQELFSSSHGKITAGTYTLSTDMTPSDIIAALAENYVDEAEETTGEETTEETQETTEETAEEAESAESEAGSEESSDEEASSEES